MKTLNFTLLYVIPLLAGILVGDMLFTSTANTKTKLQEPKHPYGSIVRLVDPNGLTFCSGTVISPTVILTAAHCVNQLTPFGVQRVDKAEVRTDNNKPLRIMAKVVEVREFEDIAFLYGNLHDFTPYPKIKNNINNAAIFTSPIIACGYPANTRLFCLPFMFKGVDIIQDDASLIVVTGAQKLIPGMSGGPVFDSTGNLIGINDALNRDPLVDFSYISLTYNLDALDF